MMFRQILTSCRSSSCKNDFKDIKFPDKIRDIHKIAKYNCIGISITKASKNTQSKCQKILLKNMLIYHWLEKKPKDAVLLSKILAYSYTITHYIVKENVFVVIFLQAFTMKEIIKSRVNDCFKINGKQIP